MSEGRATGDEALRERAELYLRHELTLWARPSLPGPPAPLGTRQGEPDKRARGLLRRFRGEVDVLKAIGILGEGEASAWVERFESGLQEQDPGASEPARDPAVEERARRLLDGRLAQAARSATAGDERAAMSRFGEALVAVRATGALSREETEHWSQRLSEAASTEGQEWLRGHNRSPLDWKGTELERVVVGSPDRHADLAITHAELHADAVVIHWHRAAATELPDGREPSRAEHARAVRATSPPLGELALEVGDDLATRYEQVPLGSMRHGSASSDDVVVAWGSERFMPAIAPGATELRVGFEGALFRLALVA